MPEPADPAAPAASPASAADQVLAANAAHADAFDPATAPYDPASAPPSRHVAVLTCMDARIEPRAAFGLGPGEAHVLRNAGGIVTDDVVRSLTLSQRKLGTTEVLVVQHTACGILGLDDEALLAAIEAETGVRPGWAPGGFADVDESVRAGVARLRSEPALPHCDGVLGFVYDVATSRLREVT